MGENINLSKDWLKSQSPGIEDLDGEFNIIQNGIVDSLHFLELVYLIESLSGQEVDMSSISILNFSTLNSIEEKFFPNG